MWIEMWVWLGGGVIQSHRGLSLHYSSLLHLQMIDERETGEPDVTSHRSDYLWFPDVRPTSS